VDIEIKLLGFHTELEIGKGIKLDYEGNNLKMTPTIRLEI
jgi:hypothetical protein